MPAVLASWCRRRVAACRSIRAPRRLSRTGPRVRDPAAWSIARPTAGGSGTRTPLGPLAHTRSARAVLFTEVGDVGSRSLEDPQAEQAEHGHQREVVRIR